MTGTDFTDSDCSLMRISGSGDWSYTIFRYQNLSKQDFSGVRFFGADLTGSRFTNCKLRSCDFTDVTVHETSFYGSDLRDSTFSGMDIAEVNLKNAKIDLTQCVAITEFLTEAKFSPETKGK